ncbi:hypothetical protein CMI47_18200 [Candidatus Pacearchaeota archaeon]|jgi:hypothetical protein|nr:hypothetical protein [Candidatus Pacearchaeota archaeon]|tara:strand:+ start:14936 stop:15253 length:318 start_codon:yes stop_codon:yes gene_type:complete
MKPRRRSKKKKEPKFKRIKGKVVYRDLQEILKKIHNFQNMNKKIDFFVDDDIAPIVENILKDANLCFDRTKVYKLEKFILKPRSDGDGNFPKEFDEFFSLFKLEK